MIALGLCLLAFLATFVAGRRASWLGLFVTIAVGYFYGILRANIQSPVSHFIFDAALVGLYCGHFFSKALQIERARAGALRTWVVVLISWPILLCLLPFQSLIVTLVGFRGNAFLLPIILLGPWLLKDDTFRLSYGLALLNLVALLFAGAEYFQGVERFFPPSAVTELIHRSTDAAGHYRIPSTFPSAHAYAGTMVMTLPFLFGGWAQFGLAKRSRIVLLLGMTAALLGVLMAATRSHFAVAATLVLAAIASGQIGLRRRFMWAALIVILAVVALNTERFQRFKQLGDTEAVAGRIAGSVNRGFWEILVEHPMGNGLGGGGTSLPYFLQSQVRNPIGMESEYARILSEQGIIGLLLWVGFIAWVLTRVSGLPKDSCYAGRRLAWLACVLYFGTGLIGVGLLTSIPQSLLMLVCVGWISVQSDFETSARFASHTNRLAHPAQRFTGACR